MIFPSVYLNEKLNPENRIGLVKGRVRESFEMAKLVSNFNQPSILTYIRYAYTDTRNLLSEMDLYKSLEAMKSQNSNGAVLWGSSTDLNSR